MTESLTLQLIVKLNAIAIPLQVHAGEPSAELSVPK